MAQASFCADLTALSAGATVSVRQHSGTAGAHEYMTANFEVIFAAPMLAA